MTNLMGEKIRKLRKGRGLTLAALATATASSKSYIWELENKSPPRPSAEKLSAIAEKLGTTIDYLLDGGKAISAEDARDIAFYQRYRELPHETKRKIRRTLELWSRPASPPAGWPLGNYHIHEKEGENHAIRNVTITTGREMVNST